MTAPEHDDEFDVYLKRRLPIHRRVSALERLEPPGELDRIVISRARQAIQTPSPVRIFRAPKWALPVALAATLVISFTLLLHFGAHAVKPSPAAAVRADAQAPAAELLAQKSNTPQRPPATPGTPMPATWLKQIERLRAEGKMTAAEQELRRFRDAYPDYKAPAGPPPADGPTQ